VLTGQISTRRNGRGEAVDPAAFDPESRRLVERGVDLTADDIDGLRLGGELAERAGLPEPAVPLVPSRPPRR
jgi:hypothetical protein